MKTFLVLLTLLVITVVMLMAFINLSWWKKDAKLSKKMYLGSKVVTILAVVVSLISAVLLFVSYFYKVDLFEAFFIFLALFFLEYGFFHMGFGVVMQQYINKEAYMEITEISCKENIAYGFVYIKDAKIPVRCTSDKPFSGEERRAMLLRFDKHSFEAEVIC